VKERRKRKKAGGKAINKQKTTTKKGSSASTSIDVCFLHNCVIKGSQSMSTERIYLGGDKFLSSRTADADSWREERREGQHAL
jgi:hypothetical protein